METIYRSSKIFLRVSLSILLWLSITKSLDAQEWYNANWQYRSPVTVTNPGGTTLSDFQVKVTLSTGNFDFTRVLNDGSDIRLTASDGTTLIPFWIEPDNWNYPTSVVIWVKVPSIPGSGAETVYLYYGNPSPPAPNLTPVETPPVGPFGKALDNYIIPIGDDG